MKLMNYIKGFRKGKTAYRLEKEAMQDPFLSEALEGYEKVPGDHEKAIRDMQQRVTVQTKQRKGYRWVWGAAAMVTGLLFVGGYYVWNKEEIKEFNEMSEVALRDVLFEEDTPVPLSGQDLVTRHQETGEAKKTPALPSHSQERVELKIPAVQEVLSDVDEIMESAYESEQVEEIAVVPFRAQKTYKESAQAVVDTNRFSDIDLPESEEEIGEMVEIRYVAAVVEEEEVVEVNEKKSFQEYVLKNRRNLQDKKGRKIKGSVVVGFTVDEKGKPHSIRIIKKLSKPAEREAIRLVEEWADWTPADGEKTVIITFE